MVKLFVLAPTFIRVFSVGILLILPVLLYQNCSPSIQLSRVGSTAQFTSIAPQKLGQFCTPAKINVSLPQKIIMLVDMSASNAGSYMNQITDVQGNALKDKWYLGAGAMAACVSDFPATATTDCKNVRPSDVNAQRFDAILNYLNTCPQNNNIQNKYGVIGFSSATVPPESRPGASCQDPLSDKSSAISDVSGLQRLQQNESASSPRTILTGMSYPFRMDGTSYSSGLQCLQNRIYNDVQPNGIQRSYKVLFISDGQPDETGSARAMLSTSLTTLRDDLMTRFGHKLIFQPIYYGLKQSDDPVQFTNAQTVLRNMAQAVDPAAPNPVVIDPMLSTFSTDLSADLCNTAVETIAVPFDNYAALQIIPLTSQQLGREIFSDQDHDGLNDDFEDSLVPGARPFLKTKSRSTDKILDSLCYHNVQLCNANEPALSCNANLKVGFGFSDCDKKFIDQFILKAGPTSNVAPFTGFDYDQDGILDYFELIKGTNMFRKDMAQDTDGDGATSYEELMRGTDPQSYSDTDIATRFSQSIHTTDQESCSTRTGLTLWAEQMPFVSVEGNLNANLDGHVEGENTFAIVYFARPKALDTKSISVFVRYLKVRADQTTTLSNIELLPQKMVIP